MIQRLQTVYLLLSVLIGLTAVVLNLCAGQETIVVRAFQSNPILLRYSYIACILLSTAVATWSIFMYRNRRRQMRFVGLATSLQALACALLLSCYFLFDKQSSWLALLPYLPIGSIILNVMAKSRIKFDEDLVRSADRLR